MAVHLRQICLATADLDAASRLMEDVLGLPSVHEDPAVALFGLRNRLFRIGNSFLELVTPEKPGTAVARFLERNGGDGGYMVITHVTGRAQFDAIEARAGAAGVRTVFSHDADDWRSRQFHPADMGGSFLDIEWDDADDPAGKWAAAGGLHWREPAGPDGAILSASLAVADPQATADRWGGILGIPAEADASVPLADAMLRFGPADGKGGLVALTLRHADPHGVLARAGKAGALAGPGRVTVAGMEFALAG
jgi:catechol 2,3-dioxygenase-like lactoylglutathione lyase family enzyme